MREYKFLSLSEITKYEDEMERLMVSAVARGPRGFLAAYKRVGGNPNRLSDKWKEDRYGFIRRHLAQYKLNPTRRRKLSLIAWAYMPYF